MMKFRLPSSDRTALPGELRVEVLGRFANYLFASGWVADCAGDPPARTYRFADSGQDVQAEYSYHFADGSDPSRTGFLDLFWVNDGYRLTVGPSHPVTAALADPRKPGLIRQTDIHRVEDGAFAELLRQLKTTNRREVWSNRIVFEILNHCNDDDRAGFFAVAIDRIGWHAMNEDVIARLASNGRDESHTDYLDFLCLCISGLDARHLPIELRERFVRLSAKLRVGRSDRRLARDVVRQLARIEPDLACEFAHGMIATLDHDREALADCMRHCFPQDSQWWIHHALLNEELGPEQAADALNCAGSTAAAEGRAALARLCYEAALRIAPESQSPAWNAGWLRFETGDLTGAAECFKRITRHYTHQSLSTRWPHAGNLPWPLGKLDAARFILPEGVTAWPRISVVTPSYNQGCYIEETILSVLNQGYPNLQYIIVDGNSTDSTQEVLERYRDRLDHLIIESDNGQTEAINKGLRLVDGEIVAWINSDDVYAPGALHVAALHWLETKSDLIAGICVEHTGHHMRLFNKPAASNADFNPPQLARIFRYWFNGWYFHQPEVFFSKRLLDKTGLLDESLHYAMDYDLWMRCAMADGTLEVVDWPFAFFRRHDAQKTADMASSVEEQAMIRDRYVTIQPDALRESQVTRMLDAVRRCHDPVIGVVSSRLEAGDSASALSETGGKFRVVVASDGSAPELARADLILLLVHGPEDLRISECLRTKVPKVPVAAWFLNGHSDIFMNHAVAETVDAVIPAQAACHRYLRNDHATQFDPVPPGITRWAAHEAADWFQQFGTGRRSASLLIESSAGLAIGANPAAKRFVENLIDLSGQERRSLDITFAAAEGEPDTGSDLFKRRCGHVAALVPSSRGEVSAEVFEALLAGQIPLVPDNVEGLEQVIPVGLQESLPVIRFSLSDPRTVVEALRSAIDRHAEDGKEGVTRRHRHALEQHMFNTRLASILQVMALARPLPA